MSEENVGGIVYTVDADIRPFVEKMATTDKGLDDFGKAMDSTAKNMKAVNDSAKSVGSSVSDMSSTMSTAQRARTPLAHPLLT